LVKLFPEARYIHWIRNPLDAIRGHHYSDKLGHLGVRLPQREIMREKRYQSWLYQEALIESTPRPKFIHNVWFEDFVLRQDKVLAELEEFLGIRLVKIAVNTEAATRYVTKD
jgi:hypothetical protein